LGLALALIALVVNILIPQGFMTVAGGLGPTLVICSGHGPVTTAADLSGQPSKSPKSKPDAPCAFAGHGVATAPAPILAPATLTFARLAPTERALSDLVPGQGLASPPPPSQAPPEISLI
jgi:hypothetical protein